MDFPISKELLSMSIVASLLIHPAYANKPEQTIEGEQNATAAVFDGAVLRLAQLLSLENRNPSQPAGPVALPSQDKLSLRLAAELRTKSALSSQNESGNKDGTGHTPAVQALLQEYYKERYPEVASRGLTLLDAEPDNAELRYIVANSLAWTGHHEEALLQYQALRHTRYRERALLGAGNVNRWNGRPDLAASAYQDVLSKEPGNNDAREGMLRASRELRPRTEARLGRAGNSNDSFRSWATLGHQWRNATGAESYELLAGQLDEDKNNVHLIQRDLAFRYASLESHIAQMEISAQQAPRTKLFGSLTLKAGALPADIDIGHINWGKLAFDPAALQAGLTANRLGLSSRIGMRYGESRLAYNLYRISDGNLVQNGSLHFTPSHQPFSASGIRGFVGLEGRKSRFVDPRYWSPEEGHYNALAGISADWSSLHWQSYGSIQYGIPLTGSSGRSWSTGFGMKRWLGNNWAASFDLWAIHTPRDGGYRSHSGILRVENLW